MRRGLAFLFVLCAAGAVLTLLNREPKSRGATPGIVFPLSVLDEIGVEMSTAEDLDRADRQRRARADAAGPRPSGRTETLTLVWDFKGGGPGPIELIVLVPQTWAGRQDVHSVEYSRTPSGFVQDGNSRYAVFRWVKTEAVESIEIDARVTTYDNGFGREDAVHEPLTEEQKKHWTRPTERFQSEHPFIVEAAEGLDGRTALETAERVHAFVIAKMRPGQIRESDGAVAALSRGSGDCQAYTDLYVALCRACGVPARSLDGIVTEWIGGYPWHAWAEVHVGGRWAAIDVRESETRGGPITLDFGAYVRMTDKRTDHVLNGVHYWAYRTPLELDEANHEVRIASD